MHRGEWMVFLTGSYILRRGRCLVGTRKKEVLGYLWWTAGESAETLRKVCNGQNRNADNRAL